mgnify:CR=1 FL=1
MSAPRPGTYLHDVIAGLDTRSLPDDPTGQIHVVKKVLAQAADVGACRDRFKRVLNFGACHPISVSGIPDSFTKEQ